MKTIILLTANYPFFAKGEEFIESEMHFLKEKEYDVQIYAVKTTFSDSVEGFKPENVKAGVLLTTPFSNIDKIKCCLRTFRRRQFQQELFELLRSRQFKNVRTLIGFCSRGERIYKALEKAIGNNRNVVLYSYWLVDSAYAIALLKEKYGYKAISRVHGGDLYEERHNGYLPMRRYLFDILDAVYSVSEKGTRYLTGKYGHTETIKTSYLGTENNFAFLKDEQHKLFHIVSCSRLVPLKRVPIIAEALSLIKDKKIIWTHFGDGIDRDTLFEVANRFSDNIIFDFKGDTAHDDVISFYKSFVIDLFLNVSTTEGLPISIMEAISFGIPVMATDVGGNTEIVKDGENGIVLSPEITSLELGEKIVSFSMLDEAIRNDMRKKAYKLWNERFNSNVNYANFYNNL